MERDSTPNCLLMAIHQCPRYLSKVALSILLGGAILLGAGTAKDGCVNAESGKGTVNDVESVFLFMYIYKQKKKELAAVLSCNVM